MVDNVWRRAVSVTFLCFAIQVSVDADDAEPKDIGLENMTALVVELTDDEGKPIQGAKVRGYAMQMEESQGHGYWGEQYDPKKHPVSDLDGHTIVRYPAKIGQPDAPMTTKSVSFLVTHYDYVQKIVHFELGPKKAEVTLKRGCEIQLSARGSNREPIHDFGILVAGPLAPSSWIQDGEGGKRTGGASDGNWQTMLVKPQPDGVTLFSNVLPLRVRPEQAVRIRSIPLRPGIRIEGNLDANVRRPVKSGYVMTTTAPKPASNSYDQENPSLIWDEWAPIGEDGSFVLKSIPGSGKIQVMAFCDGWVSATTFGNDSRVAGQLFDIEGEEMSITVEMEETGTVELEVKDPKGNPLDGGFAYSCPNQIGYKGGSTFLGSRYSTLHQIAKQIDPDAKSAKDTFNDDNLPFYKVPIKNGKAVLRGLPINHGTDSVILGHDDCKMAPAPGGLGGEIEFKLVSKEIKKIVVKTVSR